MYLNSQLKDGLRQLSDMYLRNADTKKRLHNSFYELVLNIGTEYHSPTLPSGVKKQLPKLCFHNCFELANENRDLIYCEGYAIATKIPIPIDHAWLITPEGQVIEPTIKLREGEEIVYQGIAFDLDWLIKLKDSRELYSWYSVIQCNYLENFSFLREGFPKEAFYVGAKA